MTLSWILQKDAALFSNKGGVPGFVKSYVDAETLLLLSVAPITVRYFEHGWTLNDLAQSDNQEK